MKTITKKLQISIRAECESDAIEQLEELARDIEANTDFPIEKAKVLK